MAQANLGLMYEDGDGGLPHDMVRAYKWFALSAEQGNASGRHSFDEYNLNQCAHARAICRSGADGGRVSRPKSYEPTKAQRVTGVRTLG